MTDANKTQIAYILESTFGADPGASPLLQVVPGFQSESLRPNDTFRVSPEISGSREILDRVRLDRDAGGSIQYLLRYGLGAASTPFGWPDDFFMAALQSANWVAEVSNAYDDLAIAVRADPAPATITKSGGTFQTDGYITGGWIKITGSSEADNNVTCRIVETSETVLTVIAANSDNDLTAVADDDAVTITQASYIQNGATQRSYSIVKRFTGSDVDATYYEKTYGATLSGMSVRWSPGDFVGGAFDFLGSSQASGDFTGTPTFGTTPTEDLMNAVENVTAFYSSDDLGVAFSSMSSLGIVDFSFQVQNQLRGRKEIATLGNVSIGAGDFDVTGSLQMTYDDADALAYMTAMLAKSERSFFLIAEKNSKSYIFDFPRVFFTAGGRNATGKNVDVPVDLTWGAVKNTFPTGTITEPNFTMRIHRFDA